MPKINLNKLPNQRQKNWCLPDGAKQIQPLDTKMKIVVPTLGRENNQKVIYQIPDELKDVLYLVTKSSHAELLKQHNPGFNVLEIPDETNGIAETRQRCVELFPNDKIWMIDDLVKLQTRDINKRVVGKADFEEVLQAYQMIQEGLDHFAMVALGHRTSAQRNDSWKTINGRSYSCYGLRTDIMTENNISFDGLYKKTGAIFFEDHYAVLSFLTNGYPNAILCEFLFDHNHNKPGGNSLIRNPEQHEISAKALKEEFPNFVKVVIKNKEKAWAGNMSQEVHEVELSWKKAFLTSSINERDDEW